MCGLTSRSRSAAAFDLGPADVRACRRAPGAGGCVSSTTSKSTSPSVPTPPRPGRGRAASPGRRRRPAARCAALSLRCPAMPDLGQDQVPAVAADLGRERRALRSSPRSRRGVPRRRSRRRRRRSTARSSACRRSPSGVASPSRWRTSSSLQVDVDEAAQRAVVGVEVALQGRVARGRVGAAPRRRSRLDLRPRPARR